MIGSLRGYVSNISSRFIIVDVNGVGYRVFLPLPVLQSLSAEQFVMLYTHMSVRENALDLYGFISQEDLDLFELLTTVSGVGPKAALTVMDKTTSETLRSAIAEKNVGVLQNTQGIGKKTAEKIVLELSEKITILDNSLTTDYKSESNSEIVIALEGLGFRPRDIHQSIADHPELKELETNEKIKRLISLLGR